MQFKLHRIDILLTICSICLIFVSRQTAMAQVPNDQARNDKMNQEEREVAALRSSPLVGPLVNFTANIFKNSREDNKNVIVSPISIHKALNLVLLGADQESQTKAEIESALGYGKETNSSHDKFHQAYTDIIKVFDKVNKAGREALKAIEARNAAEPDSEASYKHIRDKPPIVEVWSKVVAKNKAELNGNYLERVKKYYGSAVERVQDQVPETKAKLIQEVNKWAKEAGFASDLMKPTELDKEFSALLLSAIRVQAFWFDNFHEHEEENMFYNYGLKSEVVKKGKVLSDGDIRDAVYLELTSQERAKQKHLYAQVQKKHPKAMEDLVKLNARVVEVPMEGKVKFTIIEPIDNGTGTELAKMLDQLLSMSSDGKQSRLAKALEIVDDPDFTTEIDYLSFPQFKFESDIGIKMPLKALGVNRIFDSSQAQLSNITLDKVFISEAKHQAVIEVNKFGLKAAALTQFKAVPLMLVIKSEPLRISIQNPFLFMVRYENIPLFIGQVVEL